ncbi:MAG: DMT family transporter [Chloroflexota bacterium]
MSASLAAPTADAPAATTGFLRAALLMCVAMFFWAVVETVGSRLPDPYSPYEVVWVRYGTHLLLMLLVCAPRHGLSLVRTRRPRMHLGRGLLMLGMPVCFISAVGWMSAGEVMAVFWLSPVFVMALSAFLLGERLSRRLCLATAVAFAGVLAMQRPTWAVLSWGAVLALGMAFCFSLYLVMTRVLRAENPLASLFYTAICVFLPLSVGLGGFWQTPTPRVALMMASIGLFGFLCLFALDRALHAAPASSLAPFVYTEPIWFAGVGWVVSGSLPTRALLAGGLLVAAALVYLLRYSARGATP